VSVQIGFIAYRNDKGDFIQTQPIFANIENKGELTEIEKKPLRQIGRWIYKQYKDKQMNCGQTAIKSVCE
jgi:hypothetical protein